MAKSAKNPENVPELPITPLGLALTAFEPRDDLRRELLEALDKALGATAEIGNATEEQLVLTDTQQKSRLTYAVSLLRLLSFLRDPAGNKKEQATLALGYIKHAEDTKLAALGMGRSRGDESLRSEVDTLRAEMSKLADAKARAKGSESVN